MFFFQVLTVCTLDRSTCPSRRWCPRSERLVFFFLRLVDRLCRPRLDPIGLRLRGLLCCFLLHQVLLLFVWLLFSVTWLKIQLLISAEEKCVSSQSPTHDLELSGSSDFRHTVLKCGSSYSFLIFCSVLLFCTASTKRGTIDVFFART